MSMTVSRAAGYTAATILTIGISQAIGIVGLFCTVIKAMWDEYQLVKYVNLRDLKKFSPNKTSYIEYQRKVEYYSRRSLDNRIYAKAFALSLVSLSLNHACGLMAKSFAIMISDIALGLIGPDRLRRKAFYMLSGQQNNKNPAYVNWARKILHSAGTKEIKIPVISDGKGKKLDAIWLPSRLVTPVITASAHPTVILFHANACTLEGMIGEIFWYHKLGFNILAGTFRGYPKSSPEMHTTELSTYHDAKAHFDYVKKTLGKDYPNSKIVAHGLSMGTSLAISLASLNRDMPVVLDVPFSKIYDTVALALKNYGNRYASIFNDSMVERIATDVTRAVFPTGEHDGTFTSDALNNVAKIQVVTGPLFVMSAQNDQVMSDMHAGYTNNLGDKIIKAYNRSSALPAGFFSYPGQHCVALNEKNIAFNALATHFERLGLIERQEFRKIDKPV